MQLTIEKLVYGGSGLARTNQGVIFVPRSARGDVVDVEITEQKKDYGLGRITRVSVPSPDRRETTCPNYNTAGCCHWDHIQYERQLEYKECIIRESLNRIGHVPWDNPIARIPSPERAYRLRAVFHIVGNRLGFIQEHTSRVVPIKECTALAPLLNAFISVCPVFSALNQVHVVTTAAPGNVENALSVTYVFSGELAGTTSWERVRDTTFEVNEISALTIRMGQNRLHFERQAPIIEVGPYKYQLSSETFFQTNRFLLEPFIREVLDQAGPSPAHVLELFCGSGFFSIPLARRCGHVIGVEASPIAVKYARKNARLNQVPNIEFVPQSVEKLLETVTKLQADLVVLNPPRAGTGAKTVGRIAALKPAALVYISCNPATFAREAGTLSKSGYRLKRLTMVDQFPNTYHIEMVARFELE